MLRSTIIYSCAVLSALSLMSGCGQKRTPPPAPTAAPQMWSSRDRQTTRMEYEAQLQIMEELGLAIVTVADKAGNAKARWKDESRVKEETVAQYYAADRFVELATEYWVRSDVERDQIKPEQKPMELTAAEAASLAAQIELTIEYLDRLKKDPDSYPMAVALFKASRARASQ